MANQTLREKTIDPEYTPLFDCLLSLFLQSELPALKQLVAMGYQYKNQSELNREREDYREVLLYERLERSIRKLNPELYEDEVYYAIGQIREVSFPLNSDQMDANEQVRAKLMGLSRSTGLETITVTQDFGEGNVEKTVRHLTLIIQKTMIFW